MIGAEVTIRELAKRWGRDVRTTLRSLRNLEEQCHERIVVPKLGCKRPTAVDMSALERCIAKLRPAPEAESAKPRRKRRGDPLPGQMPLF
jgi:hypothetical protein